MENDVKQPGVMFDSQLVEHFRPTIDRAFLDHGDVLRSVVVVFDYYGALNDTDGVNKAIWLGPVPRLGEQGGAFHPGPLVFL